VESRWPAFTFFNQLGNRWIQSRAVAVWPDGRARYAENFNTTFQSDNVYRFDINHPSVRSWYDHSEWKG
jgi:hypothetical protein